jgi:hypothetical protein
LIFFTREQNRKDNKRKSEKLFHEKSVLKFKK